MGGMGSKFAPVMVRHLVGHLGMFRPMAGTSWAHGWSGGPNGGFGPPLAAHPPLLSPHPLQPAHPL